MSAPSLAEKPSLRRGRAAKTLIISICALVAVYLVQAFSPLRLNVDVIAYLAKGAAIAEGTSDPFAGWALPPGYPYLIALLDAMGLGSSAVFVVVNVLAMVAGLLGVYGLLRHDLELGKWSAQIVCAMVLLSFVMVRHATLPMPELMFFGLATLTLWSLVQGRRADGIMRLWSFGAAIILIAVSISMRIIGIALVPAFAMSLWLVYRETRSKTPGRRPRARFLIGLAVAAIGLSAFAILLLRNSFYLEQLYHIYRDYGVIDNLNYMMRVRLTEWGELMANVPESQLPIESYWPLRVMGLMALVLVARGLYVRRGRWSECEVFFLSYVAILLVYTGHASRYWLPVLPLIFGWWALSVEWLSGAKWARPVVAAYLFVYTMLGIAAISYSSWITFSGPDFARRYGGGSYAHVYEAAFSDQPGATERLTKTIDEVALGLLRRYEPRADSTR